MHEFALNILYIILYIIIINLDRIAASTRTVGLHAGPQNILSIITDQHFVGHLVEQVWFGRTVYIGNKGPNHPYAVYLYF